MATDCFMKISDLPGESTDKKHPKWVEVESFSHSVDLETSDIDNIDGSILSLSTGRAVHGEFVVEKSIDRTSPKLASYCANGNEIRSVTIEMCHAVDQKKTFGKIELEDVVVSKYEISHSRGGSSKPGEVISFAYTKITWTYYEESNTLGVPMGEVSEMYDRSEGHGSQ